MSHTYQYAPAESFMRHRGVTIYHVYEDDDAVEGVRLTFWFDTHEDSREDEAFDVRDLAVKLGFPFRSHGITWPELVKQIKSVLRAAISSGLLHAEE